MRVGPRHNGHEAIARRPGVVQDRGELAVRHGKPGVESGGLLEQRRCLLRVPLVLQADGLRVLPERLERRRAHLGERFPSPDRPERLADPLPQALRQLVQGVDEVGAIGGRRARCGQNLAVAGRYKPRRERVALVHRVDLTRDNHLDPLPLRELAGQIRRERTSSWPLHPLQRRGDGLGVHESHGWRLSDIHPKRFSQGGPQGRVRRAVHEVSEQHGLSLFEHARRDQRAHRTDPEQAHRHVPRGRDPKARERHHTADDRSTPREPAREALRCQHGRPRRAGESPAPLEHAGHQHYRQPDHEQGHRSREYPVGQSESEHRRVHQSEHDDRRRPEECRHAYRMRALDRRLSS